MRGCRPGFDHCGINSRWTRPLAVTEELNLRHVLAPAKWLCIDLLLLQRCGALTTGVEEFALTEGRREIVAYRCCTVEEGLHPGGVSKPMCKQCRVSGVRYQSVKCVVSAQWISYGSVRSPAGVLRVARES